MILLLTSFSLQHFHIVAKAFCLLPHTQVSWTITRNSHLADIDGAASPPFLFPHKLTIYGSINKSAVFIFCPAVKQLNGQINDCMKAVYTFCSVCLCVCVCGPCLSVCVFLSMSSYLCVCVCGSSPFQVYRQFMLHPVIMAQRYTHYVSVSVRHCSNPL